jgi:DNA polymerase-3 subunit alpha
MIRNKSHYSLLLSTSRVEQIVAKAKELGYDYAGLADFATISGCVKFIQCCKKNGIKPIIGSEIVLSDGGSITLICRNKEAWRELLNVTSIANSEENYDGCPKISFDSLMKSVTPSNFVCIDGYVGSRLFHNVFSSLECVFNALDADSVSGCISGDWDLDAYISNARSIFPHYYVEIDLSSSDDSFPAVSVLSDMLHGLDCVIPDTSSYYPDRSGAVDHRVLVCVRMKTTLRKLSEKIDEAQDISLLKFIRRSSYNIKSMDQIAEWYNETARANLEEVVGLCEDIEILSRPRLPHFETPGGESENEYLKQLCRDGWKKLLLNKIPEEKVVVYRDRVLSELAVIEKADLAGYFLIVQDYVNHFKRLGCLVGPGRGSGGGSLVCYLTGITLIDPIEYGLIFERFYNEGRNTEDHVSLPDIDVDFPPEYRDEVIKYLREKYGDSRVCQMLTFGRLAGRSILKEVLRTNESCTFDEMNRITEAIQSESAISDLLEEMEDPSVIRWTLENDRESLADYCWINDEGILEGQYAREFNQAMRMEGIFKTQGKHAAGVVIASDDLDDICPMVKASRGSEKIAGMEMNDLESIGCVKFDILGLSILGKIARTAEE